MLNKFVEVSPADVSCQSSLHGTPCIYDVCLRLLQGLSLPAVRLSRALHELLCHLLRESREAWLVSQQHSTLPTVIAAC